MKFEAGTNIAIKIPVHLYEETVHFYRDVLLLDMEEQLMEHPTVQRTHKVAFGACTLWLDCVAGITTTAVWLEIKTTDIEKAPAYLQTNNTQTLGELELIPDNMHWIKDPSGTVLLLNGTP